MTSADSRLAASSKEIRVRVESSKNRLTTVRPRRVGSLRTSRPAIACSIRSAVDSTCSAVARFRSPADSRCRGSAIGPGRGPASTAGVASVRSAIDARRRVRLVRTPVVMTSPSIGIQQRWAPRGPARRCRSRRSPPGARRRRHRRRSGCSCRRSRRGSATADARGRPARRAARRPGGRGRAARPAPPGWCGPEYRTSSTRTTIASSMPPIGQPGLLQRPRRVPPQVVPVQGDVQRADGGRATGEGRQPLGEPAGQVDARGWGCRAGRRVGRRCVPGSGGRSGRWSGRCRPG